MSIFNSLRLYAEKWNVKDERSFTNEEINAVASATVVASEFGNSVCFALKAGGQTYIPLSNDSSKGIGETVDMTEAKVLTLTKSGENDIYRVKI